ncbi:hypothetical protein K6U58_05180 [Vibrio fluvialis]|uniref:serine O-acetyltransferase n=1 Tax=Vibrio fluvialis TaxID=676 RepID=UPI001EEA62EC|nr:hypothetical protein [Vibrio fluvialis]MCG6357983.1 hypothetical protein [Vibrio fluvialis]
MMVLKILKSTLIYFYSGSGYRVEVYLKAIFFLKERGCNRIAKYISNRLQRKFGVFISPKSNFDNSLKLKHPTGIVIGEGVTLGKNVTIYQNVTLGGARIGDAELSNYPSVGDGTTIFAGAVIIGKITVGKNSIIGANSVVTRDVPDDCKVAGVPARIIGKK